MLVERDVKDRYLSASITTITTAADVGVNLIQATHPQKLRVRMLKTSIRAGNTSTSGTGVWLVLALVNDTFGPGNVVAPTVSGTPVDLYEPASNVIWSHCCHMLDFDGGTGPGVNDCVWYGDGKVIDLKTGDAIYLIGDADNDSVLIRAILDMDILS